MKVLEWRDTPQVSASDSGSVHISTHQVLPQLLVVCDDAVVNDDKLWGRASDRRWIRRTGDVCFADLDFAFYPPTFISGKREVTAFIKYSPGKILTCWINQRAPLSQWFVLFKKQRNKCSVALMHRGAITAQPVREIWSLPDNYVAIQRQAAFLHHLSAMWTRNCGL